MPPKPISRGAGISAMVVGLPGVGKTPFIASGGRTLIVHPPADNMDSIPPGANVEEWVVEDWTQMYEVQMYCNNEAKADGFDWVWLDSYSVWQDYGLRDVLQDAVERKPARRIEKGGIKLPEFGADKGEYLINMERNKNWVKDMHAFSKEGKFNFGLTAHAFEWYDPIEELDVLAPWIQGKGMVSAICGYMNMIMYLKPIRDEDGNISKKILFSQTPGFYGKDQFDCLPLKASTGERGLLEPTMAEFDELLAKARGGSTGKRSPAKKKPAKKAPKKKR